MATMETNFPRGGARKPSAVTEDNSNKLVFGATIVRKKREKFTQKDRDDIKQKQITENQKNRKVEAISATSLTLKTITEGMVLMGSVTAIDATYLRVALPGRILGKLLITSISNSYTKVLSEFATSPESEDLEEYKSLDDIFQLGQIIYVKVMSIVCPDNGKTEILLSMIPSDVHGNIVHNRLKAGFMFSCAVEGVEDRGYIIETGIPNLRAFLPFDLAEQELSVGEPVFCKIQKIETTPTASTVQLKELSVANRKIKLNEDVNLDYVFPTTIVKFEVRKVLKDGLQGTIFNDTFTAYVNEHNLEKTLESPSDYDVGSSYNAKILYVMPLTKLVYLTLNTKSVGIDEKTIKIGTIFDKAPVLGTSEAGIVVMLHQNAKGVIGLNTIKSKFKGNFDIDEILLKYTKSSTHRVRVVGYNPIDMLYICTDDTKVLHEKYYTFDDVSTGDFVMATIDKKLNDGGFNIHVGNVRGYLQKGLLSRSTPSNRLKEGAQMKCRVIKKNPANHHIYITNLAEFLSDRCRLLTNIADAEVGEAYTGQVVQVYKNGHLIQFGNDIRGLLNRQKGDRGLELAEGQVMSFRIDSKRPDGKMTLSLLTTGGFGDICEAKVTNICDNFLEIKLDEGVGVIPTALLSDNASMLEPLLTAYSKEKLTIKVACMAGTTYSIRDVAYFENHSIKKWSTLKTGDILRATIKNVDGDIIEVSCHIRDFTETLQIHSKMFLEENDEPLNRDLYPDQVILLKVLGKFNQPKSLTLSARLSATWNGDLGLTADILETYLSEMEFVRSKLQNGLTNYRLGMQCSGTVKQVNEETGDVLITLENGVQGLMTRYNQCDAIKIGAEIKCAVLWIDYKTEIVYLTSKPRVLEHLNSDEDAKLDENYKMGRVLKGYVLLKLSDVIVCGLRKGVNPLMYVPTRLHYNDFQSRLGDGLREGILCALSPVRTNGVALIGMFEDIAVRCQRNVRHVRQIRLKRHLNEGGLYKMSDKLKGRGVLLGNGNGENAGSSKTNYVTVMAQDNKSLNDDAIFFVDTKPGSKRAALRREEDAGYESKASDDATGKKNKKGKDYEPPQKQAKISEDEDESDSDEEMADESVNNQLNASNFFSTDLQTLAVQKQDDSSSDEDDAPKVVAPTKKKPLTSAERFKAVRQEEERVRNIEESNANLDVPKTVDQFDRMVLAQPNNSIMWINYMAFQMQAMEIDRARGIARKALQIISYREEQEILNVWIALLNLELRYGSKELFDEVLKEALQVNDPYKIYSKALLILAESQKVQELEDLTHIVIKKFKQLPEMWSVLATAYFEVEATEKAQQFLHKALAALPERDHVNTIVQFANLNNKYGHKEAAHALLDQIVTSYPKRVDVWSQFVDMLAKDGEPDLARQVLERSISQKIPLKKMRTLFKKYLEFEERFGNKESVQKVREIAANYAQKEIEGAA